MTLKIEIILPNQTLSLFKDTHLIKTYPVSTGKKGVGEVYGSEKTPRGLHRIHAKFGKNASPNTVFVSRIPTGELYEEKLKLNFPKRDWILTRILQLEGLEPGKNQGGDVDTLQRCIYIHGCPDCTALQIPGSRGCIRMRNVDIIELFDLVPLGTHVFISA